MFGTVSGEAYAPTADFQLSADAVGFQYAAAFAPLADGGFVTVWTNSLYGIGSMRMQRFDLNGAKVGPEIDLGAKGGAVLAPTPSGGFLLIWTEEAPYPTSFEVKGRFYDPNLGAVGAEFSINTRTDGFQLAESVKPLAGGGYVVTWGQPEDQTFDHVRAQVLDSAGNKIGGEIVVTDGAPGDKYEMGLTALAGGGFVAAWTGTEAIDEYGNLSPGLRGQIFDGAGNKVGASFPLNTILPGNQASSQLAALPSGGFVAAWSDDGDRQSGGQPNGNQGIWVQLFDSAGQKVGDAFHAAADNMVANTPIIVNTATGFLVVWREHDSTTTGGPNELRAQRFDFAGNKVAEEFGLGSAVQASHVELAGLALDSGAILLGWTHYPKVGANSDDVRAQLLFPVVHGSEVQDGFAGTASRDFFLGKGGHDVAAGAAGSDNLDGGDGDDRLDGGGGDDVLDGGGGDDWLAGGEGKDSYSGGAGTDTLDFSGEPGPVVVNLSSTFFFSPAGHPFGSRSVGPGEALDSFGNYESHSGIENLVLTAGNDGVLGSEGANRIEAGSGNDLLNGAGGNDVIDGGEGNDTIDGGTGDDEMTGGLGNDIYGVDSAADIVVENGGEGTDEVRTTLAGYSLVGTNVENLRAFSNIAHDFRGNGSNNVVTGGTGADVIRLQDGGDDSAVAGGGDDQIFYGAAFTAADSNNGGSGTDVVILQGNYSVTFGAASLTNVEYLSLQSASSTRYQDPSDSHDYDITLVDANVAAGQRFIVNASQLLAHEDFTFNGAAESNGEFLIYGGYGADVLTGGSGNDVFHFEGSRWGSGDVVNGGAGADSLVIRAGSGTHHIQFSETQLTGIESISVSDRFGLGQASLPSYEMVLANGNVAPGGTLIVNGSTLLDPGQRIDVDGSAVRDGHLKLYGGAGGDTLIGGDGDDLFFAAGGADRMTGGAGRDVFQLRSLSDSPISSSDWILDFVSGTDKIDLSFIDADSIAAGNQAFTFIGGQDFSGQAGQLRAEQLFVGDDLWIVSGDVDGDRNPDFLIAVTLVGPEVLSAGDFLP
jgi:serralysin